MTIRGGGRPRDPRPETPYDESAYAGHDDGYGNRYDAGYQDGYEDGYEPAYREPTWRSGDARWTSPPPRVDRRRGGSTLGGFLRFLVFAVVMAGLVLVAAFTVLRPLVGGAIVDWAYGNPGALRIPLVADLVREELGTDLTEPASPDSTEVTFEVVAGDNPRSLAPRLKAQGLIRNEQAFVFEATRSDLTPKLQAGNFHIARNLTPAGVVTALVENRVVITVIQVNFRESLRLEQITAKIQTLEPPLTIDAQEFYDIVKDPPADLLADYPWLTEEAGLPEGASLEGFLGAATYDLQPETTAEELVRRMLDTFERQVGVERMAVPEGRELTFYQVLTLASIVEKEAVLDDERPLIAGVYQNRIDGLNRTRLLEADPTVLYAIDTVNLAELPFDEWQNYVFWKPAGAPLAEVPLPEELERYNTYRNRGLPLGPICTPSLASIEAALQPDTADRFVFFLAIPNSDPPGAHDFSKTLAEHNEKKRKYGYT